jgi:L-iditol 2-dehydrogenase
METFYGVDKRTCMWAQRLVSPSLLEPVEAPAPRGSDLVVGEVLVRTLAGGICGSDLPKFRGVKSSSRGPQGEFVSGPPGYPMHELVGEVLASRHPDVAVGDYVVGWAVASNALAELVITDGNQIHRYNSHLAPLQAVLIQPLACVVYAADRLNVTGKSVAVIGLGPIGALFAHVLKQRGARRVTGIDPVDRSSVSAALGIDETVRATSAIWADEVSDNARPDLTVEAVGHQTGTLEDAIRGSAAEGTILYFGIPEDRRYPLNMEMLLRKNLTLAAGVTSDRRRSLAAADRYLAKHRGLYEVLVSHVFDRDTAQNAYQTAAVPAAERLKVVLSLT